MFLHCCQDCLKMKKSWKKRVSGCNSVDVKTMQILQNFRITLLKAFPSLKAFTSTLHASSMYESRLLWHNDCSIKSKWHMACLFLFILKYAIHFYIYHQSAQTLSVSKFKWHWVFSWAWTTNEKYIWTWGGFELFW